MPHLQDISLLPDAHYAYLYDHKDPRYHDPQSKDLRDRRWAALRAAPQYAYSLALENDERRRAEHKKKQNTVLIRLFKEGAFKNR